MKKLWIVFAASLAVSFAILGWVGTLVYQMAPPIPGTVRTTTGAPVFADGAVAEGQNVWRALGGMELGSIWGHGAYVAPDWSADWLHRELVAVLDLWSNAEQGIAYDKLPLERQAALRARLRAEYRHNTYDAATGAIVVSPVRATAIEAVARHYEDVFANGRPEYAIPAGALRDPARARQMMAFFFCRVPSRSRDGHAPLGLGYSGTPSSRWGRCHSWSRSGA